MELKHIPAEATVGLIVSTLERKFPGVLFAYRLDPPVAYRYGATHELRGLDIVWVEGPDREAVEEIMASYQGIEWDPRSGQLEESVHFVVNEQGEMERVRYGIDYIFCDGPADVLT